MKPTLLAAAFFFAITSSALALEPGTSVYQTRLEDPRAVHLTGAVGDGKADDSAAIQDAIDKAAADREEGIVFIPQGRYRISRTLYVWPAVRVIRWGAKRPVFVLGDNTTGFPRRAGHDGDLRGRTSRFGPSSRPERPAARVPFPPPGSVPPNPNISDANPTALSIRRWATSISRSARAIRPPSVSVSTARSTISSPIWISISVRAWRAFTRSPMRLKTCASLAAVTASWPEALARPAIHPDRQPVQRSAAKPRSASMKRH